MTNFEMRKKAVANYHKAMKVAKAVYIVGGLEELMTYIDAKVELGEIFEEDGNEIIEAVTTLYANTTIEEADKIRKMF